MTPCIEWAGYRMPNGYGQCTWHQEKWLAHRRVMAEILGRDAIKDLFVMHLCDNRGCVNPDHLVLGTHADNMAQMRERGRYANGNTRKTHCHRGHEFTDDNTWRDKSGRRHCRGCWTVRKASVKPASRKKK